MFRFFLTKKIFSGENPAVVPDARPNRRMSQRFAFDHKKVTMMSDQDIMVVREVSETGFSSIVSERTWSRMNVGDGYSSRLRIGPEVHEFSIRVAWKDASPEPSMTWTLGFELVPGDDGIPSAWRRLIRPAALAGSLQRVDSSFMQQFGSGKAWYHGDDGCDLMIWSAPGGGGLFAWRLSFDTHFVEWRDGSGFETGRTPDLTPGVPGNPTGLGVPEMPGLRRSSGPDHRRLHEALDILSACEVEEAPSLIRLLEGELAKRGNQKGEKRAE